jgi:hypothetical protein
MLWGCASLREVSPLARVDTMVVEIVYFIVSNELV